MQLLDAGALVALFDAVLHSVWLLPVLAVLIALDGPFPVLPSETLLTVGAAAAFGTGDALGVLGLFLASLVGSMLGDVFVYSLGRSSNRILRGAGQKDDGLGAWVRRNLWSRPIVACVGARLVPGGRLVSTAACGRVRLPMRMFLAATAASSAVWGVYMLLVGAVLSPITKGNPLLCLAAGMIMAVVTAGGFELARRLRRRVLARRAARAAVAPVPVPEPALAR
ncbi:VTT domain-containing protein [Pseudonocardia kujensis]|uniref:DedA family protein n=1 Tax=Pseudonocardia kujensis TaxID=1128675 RepID=UPI001E615978|nr:VTT domain-containing protein [Pseudonocardia kujensis]MCE0764356.1 VTT domain-containing protein [Pseudonocardia kujensis]